MGHLHHKHLKYVPSSLNCVKCSISFSTGADLFDHLCSASHKSVNCEKLENNLKPYATSNLRKESGTKSQEQPVFVPKISHYCRMNTKRPIDLVYTGYFFDVMKELPALTDMRIEENKKGENQLKVRVWITAEDLYSNVFYSKIYAHLLYKKIKKGKILL